MLSYTVVAEAVQAGDARFRVELRSTSLGPDPVVEEESTTIFKIGNAPAAAAPPFAPAPASLPPRP
jgi:hypothetical protein